MKPIDFIRVFGKTTEDSLRVLQETLERVFLPLTRQDDWSKVGKLYNSWGVYNNEDPEYWRDAFGLVHMRGAVSGGTPGSTSVIFILPEGYRPAETCRVPVASNSLFGECVVNSDGEVIGAVGSGTWFDLSAITFRAEK